MTLQQKIIFVYIIAINAIAYIVMCFDKYQSKRKGQRISESNLLLLAFVLGSLGIYLGMKAPMYHKAGKDKFKFGIPVLFILNLVSLYFIYRYFF